MSIHICFVFFLIFYLFFLFFVSFNNQYRTFSSVPNVSLKIEVDPYHPKIFPTITWLGSETAVFVFRERILDRVEVCPVWFYLFIYTSYYNVQFLIVIMRWKFQVWDSDFPITTNLERLLEISLPLKPTFKHDAESREVTCCICYSERLNGEVPSRTCDNSHCGQSFHILCLYEVA